MDNIDINSIIPIIGAIIIAILRVITRDINKDKKDNIWMKILRKNEDINKCIKDFKEIEFPHSTWTTIAIFSSSIIMIFIFLFAVVYSLYLFALVSFFAFILIVLISINVNKLEEDESQVKNSKKFATQIIFVNWFVFYNILFTVGGIYIAYSLPHRELFIWNEIPGSGNETLLNILNKNYQSDWIINASIEKIEDGRTIKILNGTNSILLRLNDDRTAVNLTINDGRFDVFDANMENHKLYIYPHLSIIQFVYTNILFLFTWIFISATTIYLSVICRKDLFFYSKKLLNKKYNINFPYVHIKTNSMELKGKVSDISDDDLVLIEEYPDSIIKSVKWDSIEYLALIRREF